MKRLMILGASILQLPAIKKAKALGLDVIVVDMNPNAVGFKEKDITKLIISTTNTEEVLKAAKDYNINGIMTLASDVPMPTVAAVCEQLGLPGISPQTALNATNKAEMRKCFKMHGAPIPEFYIARSCDEFIAAARNFNTTFVTKPADNSGNRGVQLIEATIDIDSLRQAFEYSHQYSRDGRVLLEEYMDGDEFSVETISINGKCHIIQITDKLTSGAPYFVEIGHTQPSCYDEKSKSLIANAAIAGVKALGIENGPSHTEIKFTSTGPKIVEIGARLGGGCITTHLVPLSTGVDMVEACIRIALGEIPDLTHKFNKGAAIRFLHPTPGVLRGIKNIEQVRNLPGIIEVDFMKEIGDTVPVMRNGLDRVGYVIAQQETRKEAVEVCEQAAKMIDFEIE